MMKQTRSSHVVIFCLEHSANKDIIHETTRTVIGVLNSIYYHGTGVANIYDMEPI